MNEEERLKHYTEHVYLGNPKDEADRERHPYHLMLLKRPMFAAVCYAYGYTDFQSVYEAFEKPAETFREQIRNIKENQTRNPKLVLDVGAGRGELTAALLGDGVKCIAVDPSVGSPEIVPNTLKKWVGETSAAYFRNESFLETIRTASIMHLPIDTIILCETIEHITEEEFNEALPIMENILTKNEGRLIFTNWINFHPIHVDGSGWDHIREINDTTYNMLDKEINTVKYRQGSHYVLQY